MLSKNSLAGKKLRAGGLSRERSERKKREHVGRIEGRGRSRVTSMKSMNFARARKSTSDEKKERRRGDEAHRGRSARIRPAVCASRTRRTESPDTSTSIPRTTGRSSRSPRPSSCWPARRHLPRVAQWRVVHVGKALEEDGRAAGLGVRATSPSEKTAVRRFRHRAAARRERFV